MRWDAASGILWLGPVIGIFTGGLSKPESLFGSQTDYFTNLIRFAWRYRAIGYVFTPGGISWERRIVTGYYPVGDGTQWASRLFPLPNVVYDRVASRTSEARTSVRRAKARLLTTPALHYFNQRFLSKWEVHRALQTVPETAAAIPETHIYRRGKDLRHMLKRHGVIFLKPSGGSLGRGIIKVSGTERGYRVEYARGGRRYLKRVRSAATLTRLIAGLRYKGQYLMQEGLRLARIGGRTFDIRILIQRTTGGRWVRSKCYARVAQPRMLVANIAQGAMGVPLETALTQALPSGLVKAAAERVKHLGERLPVVLEETLGQSFGELGIDLGVRSDGTVWIIEVNSKPMRNQETDRGSMAVVRNAIRRPILYARYLAGFEPPTGPGEEDNKASEEIP